MVNTNAKKLQEKFQERCSVFTLEILRGCRTLRPITPAFGTPSAALITFPFSVNSLLISLHSLHSPPILLQNFDQLHAVHRDEIILRDTFSTTSSSCRSLYMSRCFSRIRIDSNQRNCYCLLPFLLRYP